MDKELFKKCINDMVLKEPKYGLQIYIALKEEGVQLVKLKATDKLIDASGNMIREVVSKKYTHDELELDDISNIADGRKIMYELKIDESYKPFNLDISSVNREYTEQDRNRILGFFFRINKNDKYIWAYQHIYPMKKIDKSKNIMILFQKNTYDVLDADMIKLENRIDFLVIEDSIYTTNIELLQNQFGFDKYIREQAESTIRTIEQMKIVSGIEKFVDLASKSQLTFAKKLMKAQNSPVLKLDSKELILKLKTHNRYKDMLEFKKNKIVVSSQTAAKNFVKMLNDDIVKSDLTGQEYDSHSKYMLEPIA